MRERTLVLGLGNIILGDDGVGIRVVRELKNILVENESLTIVEASPGGLVLLDLIAGYDTVVVIDAIMSGNGKPPGSLCRLNLDDLGGIAESFASHTLDLRTAIELGKKFGYKMPHDTHIFAVEIAENTVFREGLTPEVEKAVPSLVKDVMDVLREQGNV